MEEINAIIEKKGSEVVHEALAELNNVVERSKQKLEEYIKNLQDATKIILPVNVLEILAKGGIVRAIEFEPGKTCHIGPVVYHFFDNTTISLTLDHYQVIREVVSGGKYRLTLIVEKLS